MQKGIWIYQDILNYIESEYRITSAEGNTPIKTCTINKQKVTFKLETKNPTGSFKDRSLAYWISSYYAQGIKSFVISSSGNAAISAAHYCGLINANLKIFVSENIPLYKLEKLNAEVIKYKNIEVAQVTRPKSDAIKFAAHTGCINLRGSSDDLAIEGFKTLGMELCEQQIDTDAVFTCCSSGASLLGIYEGLKLNLSTLPQLNIVQTTKIHPIASTFDSDFISSPTSLANAVSDKVAKRKQTVIQAISATNGTGWVVSDVELKAAKSELITQGIEIEGYNAYVSYAGFKKALAQGRIFKNPVCIISGY